MPGAERALVVVLRIDGAVQLLGALAVVMPFAWMAATHRFLGMGELPQAPIVEYLARSLSVLYALRGALVLFVSRDVRRYGPLIRFWAMLVVVLGLTLLGTDVTARVPLFWTVLEGTGAATSLSCVVGRESRGG